MVLIFTYLFSFVKPNPLIKKNTTMASEFNYLDTEVYEKLPDLQKNEYHLQKKWNNILPWLYFLVFIHGIGIICGLLYLLIQLMDYIF
jgi:hypothetical protein